MASKRARRVSLTAGLAGLMLLPSAAFAHAPEDLATPASHGPDAASTVLREESAGLRRAPALAPPERSQRSADTGWCGNERTSDDTENEVTNGDGKFHVIYAYAADQSDRFSQLATYFEAAALESSNILIRTRGRALRYDLGTTCGPDNLDISSVRLALSGAALDRERNGDRTFGLVSDELRARGFNTGDKNYLVFLDAPERRYCGEGAGYGDNRRGPQNYNEGGGRYAIVYRPFDTTKADGGFCGGAALHEQLHVLGIVPPAAPHNNGSGHCNDAREDVICGEAPVRGGGPYVDFNSDDYFDPPGGALGWWTVNLSRYVCPDASCNSGEPVDYLPPTPAAYRGPRYHLRFHNVDDDHCAFGQRASDGRQVRLFCAGYQADRTEDLTGALVALSGGAGSVRVRLVARNHDPGGGRTLGITLRRGDGALIVDERHGVAGSESSDLPEAVPDPSNGYSTFYERTVELDLRSPLPPAGGASGGGSTGGGSTGEGNAFDDHLGFGLQGDSDSDSDDPATDRCRAGRRRWRLAAGRVRRAEGRNGRERRVLVRRYRSLRRGGWPVAGTRAYERRLRRYRGRLRVQRRLERSARAARRELERAC